MRPWRLSTTPTSAAIPPPWRRFASNGPHPTNAESEAFNRRVKAARHGDTTEVARFDESEDRMRAWGVLDIEKDFGKYGLWRSHGTMYRLIDQPELAKLLAGEFVKSPRYQDRGQQTTDVTNNPDYGKVGRQGKYRLTFKPLDKFDPALKADGGQPQTRVNHLSEGEYHLCGSYHLVDVKAIERYEDGCWVNVPFELGKRS